MEQRTLDFRRAIYGAWVTMVHGMVSMPEVGLRFPHLHISHISTAVYMMIIPEFGAWHRLVRYCLLHVHSVTYVTPPEAEEYVCCEKSLVKLLGYLYA